MTTCYQVYGLTFRCDCKLPDLDPVQDTLNFDYRLNDCADRFEGLRRDFLDPCYVSSRRVQSGRTVVQVWKMEGRYRFLFRFYDDVEFIVDRDQREICVDGLGGSSLKAATHHLLFSLPGFLLCLRKSAGLHGAAVGWGDGAIAFLGRSNSGKSVLCATMAMRGVHVLSDDLVALDLIGDTINVYPGYPWICLRPESCHWLGDDRLDTGQHPSKWRYLDDDYVTWDLRREAASFPAKPKKLQAIYLLAPTTDPKCKPAIEPIPHHQALMALMEAAARTHIPYREFRPQEFSFLGSVVAAVPTYALHYHLSADSLMALNGLFTPPFGLQPDEREKVEA